MLWHRRYGHVNFQTMKKMLNIAIKLMHFRRKPISIRKANHHKPSEPNKEYQFIANNG